MIEDVAISRGFRGDANLKRAGEQIEWTPERIQEYAKCKLDPIYFCRTYMRIVHVDRGLVPFDLYDYQEEMIRSMHDNRNTIITTARQIGKALDLQTKVPTPTGWSTIGKLDVGDYVIGADGQPTKIIYTSPIFDNHDCYEITFDNNTKVTADAGHLWTIHNTLNHNKIQTKTTESMYQDFKGNNNSSGYSQSRYRLPSVSPIRYNNRTFVDLDPYTLGAWLGDGHSENGSFTTHESDLEHFVNNIPYQFGYKRPSCNQHIYTGPIYHLYEDLLVYNLIKNKHIPSDYLYGSIDVRRNVLAGLMDTDGWATKSTANIQLTQKNLRLIEEVRQLIVSLGYKVIIKKFEKTNSIRLTYNVVGNVNPFRMLRKSQKITILGRPNGQSHLITNIKKIDSLPVKCLGVDNANHLFLVSDSMIPTHNSTVTCGFILWYILFNADKTVALLANKGDTAREIMAKVTLAYRHLPKWLQQGVVEDNKGSLVLENNSRVIATATSGSAIRGYSINLLFIDEAAFIENWDEFFTSVAPTISSGISTKIILVSTPNGLNHYYKLWSNAIQGRTDYNPIKVTWEKVPGRDEKWKQKTLADLDFDQDKFSQENEAEFLGSSGTLISGAGLKSLVGQIPIYDYEQLKQYYPPEPGNQYVMVCDVSKGVGLDHSAFSVFDVSKMPYQQVVTYYNNLCLPSDYAEIIHNTAITYNNATVLVEINNIGESVATMLYSDMEYEGMLFTESAGSRGKQISTKSVEKAGIDKGINTTKTVKAKGCSILKALVENQQLIINDYNTIQEISRFSKKGTSYEAESGAHDDLVMGLVLFAWLTDQQFFKELTDINTLQSLRNQKAEEIENNMILFGYVVDGRGPAEPTETRHFDNFDRALMYDVDQDMKMEQQWQALFA